MFRFFKGKRQRDLEFIKELVRASAEGDQRAQINRALGSEGIQLGHVPDSTEYCIKAAASIVEIIMRRAGVDMQTASDNEKFTGGIFSFTASNHISHIIGAEFEIVANISLLELFKRDDPLVVSETVPEIAEAFNNMSQYGRVIEAIGGNIVSWINKPTPDQIDKLANLYKICRESVG